jgi:hypothetical protein
MTVSVEQRILSIVKNKQDTNYDKLKSMIDLSAAKHTCWEVSSIQQKIPFESESFEHVFVDRDVPEFDSEYFLNEISRVLSKKGTVLFVKKTDKLILNLMIAGFMDTKQNNDLLISTKPLWDIGTSFSLSTKTQTLNKPSITLEPAKNVWTMNMMDDEDEELIDDEDLLEEDDLKLSERPKSDSCKTTRKACKGCTCGRLEEEEEAKKKEIIKQIKEMPKSACGSCYKGDAFRCSTCPYFGMPAFEPGDTLKLSSSTLFDADI